MRPKQQKIWIIDDDETIGNMVSDYLRANTSYVPYHFHNS